MVGNPDLIYMGGNNNAAASGVLKSIDYGEHWTKGNVGLFDTRLQGLHIVDDKGDHVLAGTPSGARSDPTSRSDALSKLAALHEPSVG